MALIGNGIRAGGNPCAFRFGTAYGINRASYHSTGQMRNFHFGEMTFDKTTGESQSNRFGRPPGRLQPSSWNLPIKGGAFASQLSTMSLSGTATGSQGLSPAAVSGTITLSGSALGQLISAGVASGSITLSGTATPAALLAAVASGSITLSGTAVSEGTGTFTGSGTMSLIGAVDSQGYGYIVATTEEAGLTVAGITNAILDNSDIETGYSLRETLRLVLASAAAKVSGAGGSTITIRDINDAVDRIVMTVDGNGNRTGGTYDVS